MVPVMLVVAAVDAQEAILLIRQHCGQARTPADRFAGVAEMMMGRVLQRLNREGYEREQFVLTTFASVWPLNRL